MKLNIALYVKADFEGMVVGL